jgi:hypothetical protein
LYYCIAFYIIYIIISVIFTLWAFSSHSTASDHWPEEMHLAADRRQG